MENQNISASIDLMKLNGAQIIKGKTGELHVVIPIERGKLSAKQTENNTQQVYLNMHMLCRDDKFGNNFMISRNNTKEESEANANRPKEERTYTEILGNAKFIKPVERPVTETAPGDELFEENGELGF